MGRKIESSKLPGIYYQFYQTVAASIPRRRIICDPLRTIAFGTDASFYRLVPKIVIKVESEAEMTAILKACDRYNVPATFRAAGTSLSGQAVTDSVLVIAGDRWKAYQILEDGLQNSAAAGNYRCASQQLSACLWAENRTGSRLDQCRHDRGHCRQQCQWYVLWYF